MRRRHPLSAEALVSSHVATPRDVTIAKRRIRSTVAMEAGATTRGGYLDAAADPTLPLKQSLDFVDGSLHQMYEALVSQDLLKSTLFIIGAKHGQSPIDHDLGLGAIRAIRRRGTRRASGRCSRWCRSAKACRDRARPRDRQLAPPN
jgi:hypothetical protein